MTLSTISNGRLLVVASIASSLFISGAQARWDCHRDNWDGDYDCDSGLSDAARIGIGIGIAVAALLGGILAYLGYRRRARARAAAFSAPPQPAGWVGGPATQGPPPPPQQYGAPAPPYANYPPPAGPPPTGEKGGDPSYYPSSPPMAHHQQPDYGNAWSGHQPNQSYAPPSGPPPV